MGRRKRFQQTVSGKGNIRAPAGNCRCFLIMEGRICGFKLYMGRSCVLVFGIAAGVILCYTFVKSKEYPFTEEYYGDPF